LNDIPGMSHSVVKLLLDNELRRKLGAAGRARAQKQFSPAAAADRLLSLYFGFMRNGRQQLKWLNLK
jgi:glycosyltransferase involved in cell wall biosynthesis